MATLKGHRSAITSLCFDTDGVTLCSGGADCDIVLWDLVSYTALCRLRGHKDAVTGVSFLSSSSTPSSSSQGAAAGSSSASAVVGGAQQLLVSVSKDSLMKVRYIKNVCGLSRATTDY